MAESIVGVPVKISVPDGSVGKNDPLTTLPEISVNPRPDGSVEGSA